MEELAVSLMLICIGLVAFFLYRVYVKKKTPEEAIGEVFDYVSEHKDELLALTKKDLFEMEAEELKELSRNLGLPTEGSKADLIDDIIDHLDKVR